MKHNFGLTNALRPLRESLRALWSAVTRADERLQGLDRRVAELERALSEKPREEHVPASLAAAALGVDVRTVRRWVASGHLDGRALQLDGIGRRRWVVRALALERLLEPAAPKGLPAAPAARTRRNPGARVPQMKG